MENTPVEWLFFMLNNPSRDQSFSNKLLEKAKELESNQIVNFAKWYHWKKEAGEISEGRFTNNELLEMYNSGT